MSLNEFRPVKAAGSKILVLLDEKESQSPGGIIIPDTAQKKAVTGQVRGVGPLFDKAGEVYAGARVLLSGEYAGALIAENNGQSLLAVEYEEILAVLE